MTSDPTRTEPPTRIRFDYIKSNYHRVIHADGVVGGPTGSGFLTITFWNERAPIPQQVTHDVAFDPQTGALTLGDEIKSERAQRTAIVREAEASVVMSLTVAKSLKTWLEGHIATLEQLEGLRANIEQGGSK